MRALCSGPGKLCQSLGVTRRHDGLPLDEPPFELHERRAAPEIATGPRIGLTRAATRPWRYGLAGSPFLSRPFASPSERETSVTVRPYGTWPAEVGSDTLSRVPASGFSAVDVRSGRVRWAESRPAEGGRVVVVEQANGQVADVTPAGFNARTRVHEYGGGAVWYQGDSVFFSDYSTGRAAPPGREQR